MSHPDPLFDPENAYEDDDMAYVGDEDDSNYDDYNDFYESDEAADEAWSDDVDDSMDGDHESGLASAGWGLDESYDPSYDHDEYDHGGDW